VHRLISIGCMLCSRQQILAWSNLFPFALPGREVFGNADGSVLVDQNT
jgi:hypothetical protein